MSKKKPSLLKFKATMSAERDTAVSRANVLNHEIDGLTARIKLLAAERDECLRVSGAAEAAGKGVDATGQGV